LLKGITEVRSKSVSSFPAELNLIDLKKNSGGLIDIEYIAHYLLLSAKDSLQNLIGNSIPAILQNLKGNKKVLIELSDNYIFLKKLEIFNQLAFNSSSSKISDDEHKYRKLAGLLKINDGKELKSKLNQVFKINRESVSKFIK
jgi:glutamine synthetase adenylyltransferase